MRKTYLLSAVIAVVATSATMATFHWFTNSNQKSIKIEHVNGAASSPVLYYKDENGNTNPLDFTVVSEKVMGSVVHIKSTITNENMGYGDAQGQNPFQDLFEQFFNRPDGRSNPDPQPRVGAGSGVIISENGYIVTNNHVIADAEDIEVVLNDNRSYKAKLVGADPTTDIALLQIKETGLTPLPFVNSDDVKVGQWVIAVGNPFNLTSTVTAGIVSAKGRNINILREQFAVESFIQTDAAINPGNSGGALIDLSGGLIGINTAIASPTGSYSGYGFAVPANIVSKVVEDLMNFGIVQRGVLGVMIRPVDGNLKKEKGLFVNSGAYVDSLLNNSAAAAAGIAPGDVIVSVDEQPIESSSKLQEMIARHRPGDQVNIIVNRQGKEKAFKVILNNTKGNTAAVSNEVSDLEKLLGATFETVDSKTAKNLDISGGVKVTKLSYGILRQETKMKEGFIVTKVNGKNITSVEEFEKVLDGFSGGVMLEGVYEDAPGQYYYAFGLR